MNELQKQLLADLGAILFEVPAAKRGVLSDQITRILSIQNLSLDDHRYLLGARFRQFLPGGGQPAALDLRRLRFELSTGAWPDDSQQTPFANGWTSFREVASFLGKSTKMVELSLKDKRKRDRDGLTCANILVIKRRLLLKYEYPGWAPSVAQLGAVPTIAEAVTLAPETHGY